MGEDRNREEVERRTERLRETFDDARVLREERGIPADEFPAAVENARDGYLGSAYVWLPDERGRVLLVQDVEGEGVWGPPGGRIEAGETFEEAAVREVWEETDVDCSVRDCLEIRQCAWVSDGADDRRLWACYVLFDGVHEGGTVRLVEDRWEDGEEILAAEWFAEPPEQVHEFVADRVDRWDWPGE